MRLRETILRCVIVVSAIALVADGRKPQKLNTTCPRDRALAAFQETVKSNGGTIEPVHLRQGLAVVVGTNRPGAVEAIQRAAEQYLEREKTFKLSDLDDHCQSLRRALDKGRITFESQNTSTGVMFVYLTSDTNLVPTIQDDCCKYCICPSTNARCSGCC